MFKVRHKETGVILTAYGWSGTMLRLYSSLSGTWFNAPAENYEPVEV